MGDGGELVEKEKKQLAEEEQGKDSVGQGGVREGLGGREVLGGGRACS